MGALNGLDIVTPGNAECVIAGREGSVYAVMYRDGSDCGHAEAAVGIPCISEIAQKGAYNQSD